MPPGAVIVNILKHVACECGGARKVVQQFGPDRVVCPSGGIRPLAFSEACDSLPFDLPNDLCGSMRVNYARYKDRRGDGIINVPLTPGRSFNVVANYRKTDGYVRDVTGLYDPPISGDLFAQPACAQANAAVTWHAAGDRLELGAYVNNITNSRYRIWYNANPLGGWYTLSPPVTWGVRAGIKF